MVVLFDRALLLAQAMGSGLRDSKQIKYNEAIYCSSGIIREVLIFVLFRERDKFANLRISRKLILR